MQKKSHLNRMSKQLLLLSFLIAFWACATISQFDQYAYVQTTSLKVDALSVMDLATDDFDQHKDEVLQLTSNLQKIYEYEKNRPKNEVTVKMWEKMLNEEDHLLGGFLLKWKTQGKQSKVFIEEAQKIIGPAFDQIAQLESKKIKPSDI